MPPQPSSGSARCLSKEIPGVENLKRKKNGLMVETVGSSLLPLIYMWVSMLVNQQVFIKIISLKRLLDSLDNDPVL